MLPNKFQLIFSNGFGEDIFNWHKHKQEMPMVAILVVYRTSHASFLKSNKETKFDNCDHLFSNRDEMIKSYRANQKQELHMAAKFVNGSERHQ